MLIISVAAFFLLNQPTEKDTESGTSTAGTSPQDVKYEPLSQEEANKVVTALLASEFIKDIPEDPPISIGFFKFDKYFKRLEK